MFQSRHCFLITEDIFHCSIIQTVFFCFLVLLEQLSIVYSCILYSNLVIFHITCNSILQITLNQTKEAYKKMQIVMEIAVTV